MSKYVVNFKERLRKATDIARKNLSEAQNNMKSWYDKKGKERVFQPGEKVLVLFPLQGNLLKARYSEPWVIEKKIGEVNYLVRTPERRKCNQLCHINMIKLYNYHRYDAENEEETERRCANAVELGSDVVERSDEFLMNRCESHSLENSVVLSDLSQKLKHLN